MKITGSKWVVLPMLSRRVCICLSVVVVQAQLIPALLKGGSSWRHLAGTTGYRPRDVCCSAPTGSGKTLAYVIPVVQVHLLCMCAVILTWFLDSVFYIMYSSYLCDKVYTSFWSYVNATVFVTILLSMVDAVESRGKKGSMSGGRASWRSSCSSSQGLLGLLSERRS